MPGTGDTGILALAPEHNVTETQGIQAVLITKGLGRAYILLCKAHAAVKGMIWLDFATSAFFNAIVFWALPRWCMRF